ncbi:MAG: DNA-processing protein DprA [Clostridia bacterium]|nr:DNA-processing protein DprA [Clostridia bacterium]
MFKKQYWIWLSQAFGSTASAFSDKLLYEFRNDPELIYNAREDELKAVLPDNPRLIRRLMNKDLNGIGAIIHFCEKNNVGVLTPESFLYPSSLLSIVGKPLALYYKGTIPDFSEKLSISVVGTRKVTPYGINASYAMSYDLAKSGAIVVSGMADGTDAAAHRGALDAMGCTVAVLGSGIDVVYPKKNTPLYNELILHGLVMTEYAPGMPPNGWHFPQRNRIISGLSSGVLVVEAAQRSGALITAEYAKKQGRLIYAVPGKLGEYTSVGTNALIRAGAKITTSANDIISDFKALYPRTLRDTEKASLRHPGAPSVAQPQAPTVPFVPLNNEVADVEVDNDAYMSMDVDPRIEAARRSHEQKVRKMEKLRLEFPAEFMEEDGYEAPEFWKTKSKARRFPKLSPAPPYDRAQYENEGDISEYLEDKASRSASRPGAEEKQHEKPNEPNKTDKNENFISEQSLTDDEMKIIDALRAHGKTSTDDLASAGIPIHTLLSTLTMLELRGIIQQLPGGYYTLN